MTITTNPTPPIVILPELVEADRRVAKYDGREPLSEERLRRAVVQQKQNADGLRARGVELKGPNCGEDDPYEQRRLAWRWNRIADNGLPGGGVAA
jgi:hypothetical protein